MSIKLHFKGGPLAGESFEFDDDVEEIVIGRDPAHCQVVLPADMAVVGREHMALKRKLGRYRVVLNKKNVVTVDGEDAYDDMELPERAEIRLGVDGPVMVSVSTLSAPLPETIDYGTARAGLGTLAKRAEGRSKRNRLVIGGTALVMIALAVVAWLVFKEDTRKRASEQATLEARLKAFTEEADKDKRRLAAELARLGLKSDEAVKRVEAELIATLEAQRKEEDEKRLALREEWANERRRLEKQSSFEDQIAKVKPAIYLAMLQKGDFPARPQATAWAVGRGLLATNGHVADLFNAKKKDEQFLVRSCATPPVTLRISKVTIHPGYEAWYEALVEHWPINPNTGQPQQFHGFGDVALLHVHPSDAGKLTPPLPLAAEADLRAVREGTPVFSVGYPTEGRVGSGLDVKNPTPTPQIGVITGCRDYFLSKVPFDKQLVYDHNLKLLGGASGSPIFNAEGRVVSVHFAGEYKTVDGQRLAIAGYKKSVRVDLLRELLEGTAAVRMAPRPREWAAKLAPLCARNAETFAYNAAAFMADSLAKRKYYAKTPNAVLEDGPSATSGSTTTVQLLSLSWSAQNDRWEGEYPMLSGKEGLCVAVAVSDELLGIQVNAPGFELITQLIEESQQAIRAALVVAKAELAGIRDTKKFEARKAAHVKKINDLEMRLREFVQLWRPLDFVRKLTGTRLIRAGKGKNVKVHVIPAGIPTASPPAIKVWIYRLEK